MRVVILTSHHSPAANVAVKTLLEHSLLRKHGIEIAGIVSVGSYAFNKQGFRNFTRMLQRSGFGFTARLILGTTAKSIFTRLTKWFIPRRHRSHFEMNELAARHSVPFLAVSDINAVKTLNWVRAKKPDYLASAICMQIVKKALLAIPKRGSINFHPALTHQHRGSFSAFWVLANRWRTSGATVHFMTEKLDDGEVILQRNFFVHQSDTIDCLNQKSAALGGRLLAKALVKLKKQRHHQAIKQRLGRLFSSPTRADIRDFERRGGRMFRFWRLFRF